MADNPATNVKPPRLPRTRRTVWSPEEIQKFLAAVRNYRFAALFLLELTTGICRGQVCGLKWSDVDLDASEVTVHDSRCNAPRGIKLAYPTSVCPTREQC